MALTHVAMVLMQPCKAEDDVHHAVSLPQHGQRVKCVQKQKRLRFRCLHADGPNKLQTDVEFQAMLHA